MPASWISNTIKNTKSLLIFFLALGLAYDISMMAACKSPSQPNTPKASTKILTTFVAAYTLEGSPATGTVTYEVNGGITQTVGLNEQADLGEAVYGLPVTVTINGDGALRRVFKNVYMSGTKLYKTDILKLEGFNWHEFIDIDGDSYGSAFAENGWANSRWKPDTITVYINQPQNPQATWSKPFSEQDKVNIRATIDGIMAASRGKIKSVIYLDGDKKDMDKIPVGEVWVFPSPPSDYDPTWCPDMNYTKPAGSGNQYYVESSAAWLCGVENPDHELTDAFNSGEQNPFNNWVYYAYQKWWPFLFSRPCDDGDGGWKTYYDREEEVGFRDGISGTIEDTPEKSGASALNSKDSKIALRDSNVQRNIEDINGSRPENRSNKVRLKDR